MEHYDNDILAAVRTLMFTQSWDPATDGMALDAHGVTVLRQLADHVYLVSLGDLCWQHVVVTQGGCPNAWFSMSKIEKLLGG